MLGNKKKGVDEVETWLMKSKLADEVLRWRYWKKEIGFPTSKKKSTWYKNGCILYITFQKNEGSVTNIEWKLIWITNYYYAGIKCKSLERLREYFNWVHSLVSPDEKHPTICIFLFHAILVWLPFNFFVKSISSNVALIELSEAKLLKIEARQMVRCI